MRAPTWKVHQDRHLTSPGYIIDKTHEYDRQRARWYGEDFRKRLEKPGMGPDFYYRYGEPMAGTGTLVSSGHQPGGLDRYGRGALGAVAGYGGYNIGYGYPGYGYMTHVYPAFGGYSSYY